MARVIEVVSKSARVSNKTVASKPVPSKKELKAQKGAGKTKGLTTGLRLKQSWAKVMQENFKSKMTDEQIHKFMVKEFPHRKARTLRDVSGVALARRRYNKGRFTKGVVPEVESVPYDERGKVTENIVHRMRKDGTMGGRPRGFPDVRRGRKGGAARKPAVRSTRARKRGRG